jgi:PAS domain S-box-containing protein
MLGAQSGSVPAGAVGSPLTRRVLLPAILLPVVVAALSLLGVRTGLYVIEVGLALLVTANVMVIVGLVWVASRSWALMDEQRRRADEATREALAGLVSVNTQLQEEISERRRAEAATRSFEERFSAMFDSSPAGMVLSSQPGLRYVAVNDSWLRMTGYTREDVIGKTAADVGMLDAAERSALYASADADGLLRDADLQFVDRQGEQRHCLVSTQRLAIDDTIYQFTTLVEITDRVKAEDDLRDSNHRLETALSELRLAQRQIVEQERIGALGQLASGIAHDFNNTLGPILGYSDLLLANPDLLADTEVVTEYLRTMNTAAQGAANVVSRLRDFYRRRQNGDAQGPAYLPDLIAQAISLTRPRWKDQAQANGATIEVFVDVTDVPPIEGSPSELRDALVNLILNAVDAMPAGGTITVQVRAERGLHDEQQVTVAVTDNGAGMTDEVRRHCLEAFYTTKGEHGTGLGLSIVHGTLRRHGGSLEIDTLVGQGTTMRMRLPAQRTTETGDGLPSPAPQPTVRRSLRILAVDDEPMMRQVVRRFLELDEHVVEVAVNGREAVAKLQASEPFDLVITDRAMPEMGGDELAAMVKVLTPETPVIMLTGFADLMEAVDQRPAGVDLVIAKPTTLARLRVAIATLVVEPASAPTPTLDPTCDSMSK